MYRKYAFELTLIRAMLGTNAMNPLVHDQHILARQRKLIMENSKINKAVNKYLDALPPSEERQAAEVDNLVEGLEKVLGAKFTPEERDALMKGELDKLKETFAELDTKATTVFFKDKASGLPMIGDHMVYGFMKAAGEAISRTKARAKGQMLASASYTQSVINQHVRCEEQFIVFDRDILRDKDGKPEYLQRSLRAMTAQGPRVTLAKSEVVPEGAVLKFTLRVMDGSPLDEEILKKLFEYGEMVGLGQWRSAGNGMFSYKMEEL